MKKRSSSPLVAVQCAVFNHEKYLRQCLDGFVAQVTDFPFVVIVHDDCSTDGSADIIREYHSRHPELFIPIIEEENQYSKGGHILRDILKNAILGTAAKYVAICEGDDYWTDPHKLAEQVKYLEEHPDVGLCYTDFDTFNEQTGTLEKDCFAIKRCIPSYTFEQQLYHQGYLAPMTWLARTDLFLSFSNSIPENITDTSYAISLEFFANSKVDYLPFTSATYREHTGSASHHSDPKKIFKYRKSVYDIQRVYAERYVSDNWIPFFLKRLEMSELLPMAIRYDYKEYIEECKAFAKEHRIITAPYFRYALMDKIFSRLNNCILIRPIKAYYSRKQSRLLDK